MFKKSVLIRAVKTSVLVGSILTLINFGEQFLNFDFDKIQYFKVASNYIVPYLVSSISIINTKI